MLIEKISNVNYLSLDVDEALELIIKLTDSVRVVTAGLQGGSKTNTLAVSEVVQNGEGKKPSYNPALVTFRVGK